MVGSQNNHPQPAQHFASCALLPRYRPSGPAQRGVSALYPALAAVSAAAEPAARRPPTPANHPLPPHFYLTTPKPIFPHYGSCASTAASPTSPACSLTAAQPRGAVGARCPNQH
eukprot:1158484-Pelagomonas_calceolata.AAC.13